MIVRLILPGVTATSSDGRDIDAAGVLMVDESEPALLLGTGEVGKGLSSSEWIDKSSPFH